MLNERLSVKETHAAIGSFTGGSTKKLHETQTTEKKMTNACICFLADKPEASPSAGARSEAEDPSAAAAEARDDITSAIERAEFLRRVNQWFNPQSLKLQGA